MSFRKSMLVLSLLVASFTTSCTTRYQEMLRDRDQRISELESQAARLRGENEELQRRSVTPEPAATVKRENPSLVDDVQKEVGDSVEVRYSKGRLSMGVDNSVTFDSGSTTLKDSSHRVLRNVANVMKERFAGRRFFIEGHTDTDPIVKSKWRDNMQLSMERADAVRRYLVQQGVPESAIAVVGYGQHEPRDGGRKERNRRVEIVVGDSK
ncbi:MAG: flagellar motor protein MotB [Planctomycetota bacterium]|jgi:flagellar motor protein MotB